MSRFSEKCKHLMAENGYNVYQLSQTASLERTTLQRMVSGKRLPNIEFVRHFCQALRITSLEETELIRLYKIETMGEAAYQNEEAIIRLLEKLNELEHNNYQEMIATIDFKNIELSSNVARQRYDAMLMLYLVLDREFSLKEKGAIYTNIPVTSNILMPVLERFYQRFQKKISVSQFVYFQMNASMASDNLKILTKVLPFFLANIMDYQVLYHYGRLTKNEQLEQLFPYYAITSQDVLLFSADLESAILLSDADIIAQYHQELKQVLLLSRPLFSRTPSLIDAMSLFSRSDHLENEIYSLHYQPCIFATMSSDNLYALAQNIFPEQYLDYAKAYISEAKTILDEQNPVIFSKKGLDEFCATGKYYGQVGAFFPSFPVAERISALKYYCSHVSFSKHLMLNGEGVELPKNLFFELYNTRVLKMGRMESLEIIDFMIIEESSICEAFHQFLRSLSASSYVYTPEETEQYFGKKIHELELMEKKAATPPPRKKIKSGYSRHEKARKIRLRQLGEYRAYETLDLLTNERKMAFCMVYLLYQLQEVIFYDGKTKRTNPDGNP